MKSYINSLVARYSTLLVIVILFVSGALSLFFTILTVKTVFYIVSIFSDAILIGSTMQVKGVNFSFVQACIATEAYLLLSGMLLSLRSKRAAGSFIGVIAGWALFFILNIIRILGLLWIRVVFGADLFKSLDWLLWNLLSVVMVVAIWVVVKEALKIEGIPLVQDINYLLKRLRE